MADQGVISVDKGWIIQTLTLQHRRPSVAILIAHKKLGCGCVFVCRDTVSHHSLALFLEVEANADHRKKGEEVEEQEREIKVNEFGSEAFKLSSTVGTNILVFVNNCA